MSFHGILQLSEFRQLKRVLNYGSIPGGLIITAVVVFCAIGFPPQEFDEGRYVAGVWRLVQNPFAAGIGVLYVLQVLSVLLARSQRKSAAEKRVGLFAPRTIDLTDDGIRERLPGCERHFDWSAFRCFVVRKDWLVLEPHDDSHQPVFFCSRWSVSPASWEQALSLIRSHVFHQE